MRFMDENFLLGTRHARRLYNEYARDMPIFDFHCHLAARDIAENRGFGSITEAWLGGDHYKWRALRACGVAERLITGDAPPEEKFRAWADHVPATIGNPLYHWTHLELRRYFGITELLGPGTAEGIYRRCNALLAREEFRVRGLLTRMKVRVLCTTDDPVDSLEHHARLRDDALFPVTVVPTFRPDAATDVRDPAAFNAWTDRLAAAAGMDIRGWQDFIAALQRRHDFFHEMGCRASDHGVEEPFADVCSPQEAERILLSVRAGNTPSPEEARAFASAVALELARADAKKRWVMQLHMGALRGVSTRAAERIGANTGFDSIGDFSLARPLARFLDRLDREGHLPKTVLYCLNPADNAVLATMIGNFPEENVRGKMQFGAAWWFNDQMHGMEEQMRVLADMGLLSRFIGMVTDSRSFLSFPRHEYFRRILCARLGAAVDAGELPADFALLGGIVRDVCWNNAERFFGIRMKGHDGTPRPKEA